MIELPNEIVNIILSYIPRPLYNRRVKNTIELYNKFIIIMRENRNELMNENTITNFKTFFFVVYLPIHKRNKPYYAY